MIIKHVTCLTRETRHTHSLIVSVKSWPHSETRIIYGILGVTVCRVHPSRISPVIINNNADNASTSSYALSVINARQTPGVENSFFLRCISVYHCILDVKMPLRPFLRHWQACRDPLYKQFSAWLIPWCIRPVFYSVVETRRSSST